MRDLIENYQTNINQSEALHKKLTLLLEYNTKVTANYGHNTGGSKGTISDKVERYVIKIIETEEKIKALENKIYIANRAERVLNKKEKEVIDLVKIHRNKLTKIAKILGKDKDYVKHKRDTAIKKMEEYIGGE
jgi:DNA-directed RNA polymerase specialized sigma subunit